LPETIDFWRWMDGADDDAPVTPTTADDPALLHFTTGTTGTPKGVLHVHGAVVMHYVTGLYALDLHPDDIFWCTADPGGVAGTSYGVISPLLHGVTSIVDEAEFEVHRWYRILQSQGVTVWCTTPSDLRMLIEAGNAVAEQYHFAQLRLVASIGEPLNAEVVVWGNRVLGTPIHDDWCQAETGGIMIANTPAFGIKPGSMGRPLPGIDAYVVRHDDGSVAVIDEPDVEGQLAFGLGWPSMFRSYLTEDERYLQCFTDGMYLTSDLVKRDADGYFWFVGRADDVIESTGHHPAVIGADYDNGAVQ
jgi:acetyl-CoA synthetase